MANYIFNNITPEMAYDSKNDPYYLPNQLSVKEICQYIDTAGYKIIDFRPVEYMEYYYDSQLRYIRQWDWNGTNINNPLFVVALKNEVPFDIVKLGMTLTFCEKFLVILSSLGVPCQIVRLPTEYNHLIHGSRKWTLSVPVTDVEKVSNILLDLISLCR